MKKLITLSLLIVLTSCITQKGADGTPGEAGKSGKTSAWKILYSGGYGGRETASNEVITSMQELDALYRELNIEDIAKVDFARQNVVAVFMGQKNTGGHSITIQNVTISNNTAEVLTVEEYPKRGGMVTMALTAPYCIAVIPKTKEVKFIDNTPPVRDEE